MRTVITVLPNYFGGGERITSSLVRILRKQGLRFILVTDARWVNGRTEPLDELYDSIITLPLVGTHLDVRTTALIAEAITPWQADILWMIGDDFDSIPRLRAALAPGGKVIFHLHSMPYYQVIMKTSSTAKRLREKLFKSYSRRYHSRMRQTLRDVDKLITLCSSYASQLSYEFPEYSDKITAIYNPVTNPTPIHAPKVNEITYVGRLTFTDKRVDNFLRILALAKPWQKSWHVNIIGDGPERTKLEKLATSLCLQNTTFAGYQQNPDIRKSAIICLTSDFEGWPTALIEGMQQGAVPVAFNCSEGVSEILADGRGIAVEPGDLEGYASALNELISSPAMRKQMVDRAKPFLKSLSLENAAGSWLALFRQ